MGFSQFFNTCAQPVLQMSNCFSFSNSTLLLLREASAVISKQQHDFFVLVMCWSM